MSRRRRNRFKFTEKKHSKKGFITFVLAAVLLFIFDMFVYAAFKNEGMLSAYFGSAGVFAMLASIVVFFFSIQSIREEDSFPLFPRISVVVSTITMLCWIGTYVHGFLNM